MKRGGAAAGGSTATAVDAIGRHPRASAAERGERGAVTAAAAASAAAAHCHHPPPPLPAAAALTAALTDVRGSAVGQLGVTTRGLPLPQAPTRTLPDRPLLRRELRGRLRSRHPRPSPPRHRLHPRLRLHWRHSLRQLLQLLSLLPPPRLPLLSPSPPRRHRLMSLRHLMHPTVLLLLRPMRPSTAARTALLCCQARARRSLSSC
jgi:hypothetical protein